MDKILETRTFAIVNNGQLTLVIVPIPLLILATAGTLLRFQARRLRKTRVFTDDYLALFALVLAYGGYIANLVMVVAGGGAMPITSLTHSQLVIWFKGLVANYVFWVSATAATQISVLCFYIRIFGVKTWFRTVSYVIIAIVSGWWISAFIGEVTACIPLDAAWTPTIHGKCVNDPEMCTSIGMIHVVFDFIILGLPIPIIWRLQMPVSSRIVVSSIMTLGVFASICSVLRMDCLINLGNPNDKTGEWMAMIYQVIEAPLGIFCICVPNLPPVWAQFSQSQIATRFKKLITRESPTEPSCPSTRKSMFSKIKSNSNNSSQNDNWKSESGELPLRDIERG